MTPLLRHTLEQCQPQELFDMLPEKQQRHLEDEWLNDILGGGSVREIVESNRDGKRCHWVMDDWEGFLKAKDLLDNPLYAELIEERWEQENR